MLIVNYKNYKSGFADNGMALSKLIAEANSEVYFAPPQVELSRYSNMKNPALSRLGVAQHVDVSEGERSTGFITPEILNNLGISFTIVNHAEHEISLEQIESTIKLCKKYSIKVFLCFKSIKQLELFRVFSPEYYVYEPEELIGTKNSVVQTQPETIENLREMLEGKKLLIGAGINSEDDIRIAYEMKVDGLLLSSMVMENGDPTSLLLNLINWEKKYAIHRF
ncbi:MAG: triose-phosphate isomerase [bacterium]